MKGPVVSELLTVVKMLIARFQDAEGDLIHRRRHAHIRSIHETVGIFFNKTFYIAGYRRNFTVTGRDVGIKIGILVEQTA